MEAALLKARGYMTYPLWSSKDEEGIQSMVDETDEPQCKIVKLQGQLEQEFIQQLVLKRMWQTEVQKLKTEAIPEIHDDYEVYTRKLDQLQLEIAQLKKEKEEMHQTQRDLQSKREQLQHEHDKLQCQLEREKYEKEKLQRGWQMDLEQSERVTRSSALAMGIEKLHQAAKHERILRELEKTLKQTTQYLQEQMVELQTDKKTRMEDLENECHTKFCEEKELTGSSGDDMDMSPSPYDNTCTDVVPDANPASLTVLNNRPHNEKLIQDLEKEFYTGEVVDCEQGNVTNDKQLNPNVDDDMTPAPEVSDVFAIPGIRLNKSITRQLKSENQPKSQVKTRFQPPRESRTIKSSIPRESGTIKASILSRVVNAKKRKSNKKNRRDCLPTMIYRNRPCNRDFEGVHEEAAHLVGYTCTCTSTFTRKSNLTAHINSFIREFPCPTCGKVFGRHDSMKRHANDIHNVKVM